LIRTEKITVVGLETSRWTSTILIWREGP